jgi:hypothetical protein
MCMHRAPCRGRFKLGAPRPQTQPLGRLNNLHRLKLAVKQQQLQRARTKRRKQWQKEALESIPCSSRAVWVVRARRVSLARSFCSCSPRQRIRLLITSSARAGALFVWFMELKASAVRRDAKQYNISAKQPLSPVYQAIGSPRGFRVDGASEAIAPCSK